jgi:dipeptidyl aminopeptidase/acylaminoacyl peptidase
MNSVSLTPRLLLLAALAMSHAGSVAAQKATKLREPLPIEVAVLLHGHNGRSSFDLSPDGQWIAHTVSTDESVPRDTISQTYSPTGFSFAEGDSRMVIHLTNTKTGEVIQLGGPKSTSWAAVWSPDGSRVAYYSDEGGEAGIWIWERATKKATRFPGVIARPYFGFEFVRWSADGQRIMAKILPEGVTIAQANAIVRDGGRSSTPKFKKVGPGEPSVIVRSFEPKTAKGHTTTTTSGRSAPVGDLTYAHVDLAILDLRTSSVTRIVRKTPVRVAVFTPDEKTVVYTVLKGWEANTQQSNYDIAAIELAGGAARVLESNARLEYGVEWSISPDGKTVAYIPSGQLGSPELVLVPVAGGGSRTIAGGNLKDSKIGQGEYAPLWDTKGENLYALGDGKLWKVTVASGDAKSIGAIPGWTIRATATPFGQPIIASPDGGKTFWVTAREPAGTKAGIFAIDAATGEVREGFKGEQALDGIFNLDLCASTGEIAYVSTDQQHLDDVWMFNTKDRSTRQVSHINTKVDEYELGQGKIIEWKTADGKALRGALLLPPGLKQGQRVPLIVYVYGGDNGSRFINRFGFWGDMATFNMHLFATRGFAVLYPDAPIRTGETMTDIVKSVMPGVDAAIEQGYVDGDRMAVMGQSYGSFNTLSIITQTNRFKAAVITAAVLYPDLFTDYIRSMGYYEHGQGNMGGTIWEQHDRYYRNSPLFHFDKIQTPLLIGQGETDGDLEPSEAIFRALERLGKPVEYRLYQGEGHVITQTPNVLDFWKRRLAFLAEHLDLQYDARGGIVFEGDRAKSSRSGTK